MPQTNWVEFKITQTEVYRKTRGKYWLNYIRRSGMNEIIEFFNSKLSVKNSTPEFHSKFSFLINATINSIIFRLFFSHAFFFIISIDRLVLGLIFCRSTDFAFRFQCEKWCARLTRVACWAAIFKLQKYDRENQRWTMKMGCYKYYIVSNATLNAGHKTHFISLLFISYTLPTTQLFEVRQTTGDEISTIWTN